MIAVNDAARLVPRAEVLYACDADWWDYHDGVPGFEGERWSTHDAQSNDKTGLWYLNLVAGSTERGFSADPAVINYGQNSGFQAVNFAILAGAKYIVLVGFDMRDDKPRHFFGDHPAPLRNTTGYRTFIREFEYAAQRMPPGVAIVNATPDSELACFDYVELKHALANFARY